MPPEQLKHLSRRERQIIEALYKLEQASVADVQQAIEDAPSYSSVRALMNRMVEKQLIQFRREANKYIYFPITDKHSAADSALKKLVNTFFKGSTYDAVTALLGNGKDKLTEQQAQDLQKKIEQLKD